MTTEKWTPKVGDVVAIVYQHGPPRRATVTRELKRCVEVTAGANVHTVHKFSTSTLWEVGGGSRSTHIEPWSEEHSAARARAIALGRLRKAADDAFATGEGLDSIAALPTARLDEAAAFLRALVEEAKAVKP